jgi:hypothetical protein
LYSGAGVKHCGPGDTWVLHGEEILSVSPPFDTDLFMTPDLLINASLQTATHFFSAGNFQMRLAAYLL